MKIAAASCTQIQQSLLQPVWKEIQDERPDVLLLLGDNIYLDHNHHSNPVALKAELRGLYSRQFAEPSFAALLGNLSERGARVFAIYDDHDFLGNNRYGGDYDPALGIAAREEFISWFRPPQTSDDVYSFNGLGLVDVVVLDERFYRMTPGTSADNRDAILGSQQWEWLERTISKSQAPYLLIASSTTFHTWGDESWEDYPAAFDRMRRLIGDRRGALVVSGDVHRNAAYDDSGVVEIVTSGAARKGLLFGAPRKNYAILTFDPAQMNVDLRSLKAGWRFNFSVPLNHWALP